MEIITNQIGLTKRQYFNVLVINWIVTRWWILVLIFCTAFVLKTEVGNFLKVFSFLYPVFVVIYLWYYAKTKQNKAFFKERYYKIDGSTMYCETKDNETGNVNLDTVVKVMKRKNYYLVYLSKVQFFYIPVKAFKSQEDAEMFNQLLKDRNLIK